VSPSSFHRSLSPGSEMTPPGRGFSLGTQVAPCAFLAQVLGDPNAATSPLLESPSALAVGFSFLVSVGRRHDTAAVTVEYLYAASFYKADQDARKRGWRPSGRAAWHKADGTIVCFICLDEQLAAVPHGVTVHRVRLDKRALAP
jgi:hypothetical protein